jgi:hypothetical protein
MHITAGFAARQSTHPHLPLLARTVRGIEWIAAAEIRAKLASSDIQRDHREIRFSLAELSPAVLELGTVDDVYLVATTVGDIGHQRRELRTLRGHRPDHRPRLVRGRRDHVEARPPGTRIQHRCELSRPPQLQPTRDRGRVRSCSRGKKRLGVPHAGARPDSSAQRAVASHPSSRFPSDRGREDRAAPAPSAPLPCGHQARFPSADNRMCDWAPGGAATWVSLR